MLHCEHCGGRLESYDGEPYCPDCTSYGLAQHTDGEGLAVLADPDCPAAADYLVCKLPPF
jgi:uncharacterized Zn finger protein (UPF0148 family)